MRICVISDAVFPTPDRAGGHGLGAMVSQVAEGLLERGHDVTLVAKLGSTFRGRLITPDRAEGYNGENVLAAHAWQAHKQNPFDVFLDNSHLHALSRINPNLPVVNAFHDAYQEYRPSPVLMSHGQKMLMPDRFSRAPVIHNALPVQEFPLIRQPKGYVLFIGALSEIKRPLLAIEACAKARKPLVIAGVEVFGKFPASGKEDCQYIGRLKPAERIKWIAEARIVLQLSEVESFGLTTLEAMLCGVPVVGMPFGGTTDILVHGVNGWYVPTYGGSVSEAVATSIEAAWTLDREGVRNSVINRFPVSEQIAQYENLMSIRATGEQWT